jgi:tRNA G18 (ribose-2'-O)-methylase SpoU
MGMLQLFVFFLFCLSFFFFFRWSIIGTQSKEEDGNAIAVDRLKDIKKPKIIVFGNEQTGVPRNVENLFDYSCVIPMRNAQSHHNVDSLNVGVAAGIILENATRKD